jgi:hypothetical protein
MFRWLTTASTIQQTPPPWWCCLPLQWHEIDGYIQPNAGAAFQRGSLRVVWKGLTNANDLDEKKIFTELNNFF